MQVEIEAEEISPSAEIRPLSDTETEIIAGGIYPPPPTPPGPCFPRRGVPSAVL